MRKGLVCLALIALACGSLLVATNRLTAQRIDHNEQRHELARIGELIGVTPTTKPQWIDGVWQSCSGALLVRSQTPGYGGMISALVARQGDRLGGLRVTAHQETPGIADFVSRPDDPWRAALRGRNAAALAEVQGITGATITSRALLRLATEALSRPVDPPACNHE